MATAAELTITEQLEHLRQIATDRGWPLDVLTGVKFIIGLPAKDNSWYWLLVDCEDITNQPPAWHWYNSETKAIDQAADMPKGGSYFHSCGRICAPWNRLAYKQCDPQGPHGDWQLANWMTNPKTGSTITLSAMVLRIFYELNAQHYQGRMA